MTWFLRAVAALLRAAVDTPPVVRQRQEPRIVVSKPKPLPSPAIPAAWSLAYQSGLQRGLSMHEAIAFADSTVSTTALGQA